MTTNLPWAPIYTIYRSDQPEVTVQGIVYAWAEDRSLYANAGRALVRVGDTRFPLWSRSLLKPFQLMVLYPVLKQAYPQLTDEHFAVMMASHNSDSVQLDLLEELLHIGSLSIEHLQCPSCRPLRKYGGDASSPLYHPCAGKHLAHLLYLKSKGELEDLYLSPGAEPYMLLKELLAYLMNKDPGSILATVDGCGMPNYSLSAVETAQLYHALITPAPSDLVRQSPVEVEEALAHWDHIAELMQKYPALVGGRERLDTRLMQRENFIHPQTAVIAKEGADGLLCMGIGPNPAAKDGLGLLIKLSSGYEPVQLERIANALLERFGLKTPAGKVNEKDFLRTDYYFEPVSTPATPG